MAELKSQDTPPLSDAQSAERNDSRGTDALAHLARMSGTGSTFGAADYVAINTTAVAALILGFAGALALLLSLFLFLPVVGIVCGLLAIRQIRRSNQTQGGFGFAIGGIIVSLLFGGIVVARETRDWLTVRAQTQHCAAVVARFGDEIKAGHYDAAYYDLTSDTFRARVPRGDFRNAIEGIQNTPGFGQLESIEWNHQPMEIEHMPDGDYRATFLAKVQFHDFKEPGREFFRVSGRDSDWKLSFIWLFPEKKPKKPGRSKSQIANTKLQTKSKFK